MVVQILSSIEHITPLLYLFSSKKLFMLLTLCFSIGRFRESSNFELSALTAKTIKIRKNKKIDITLKKVSVSILFIRKAKFINIAILLKLDKAKWVMRI